MYFSGLHVLHSTQLLISLVMSIETIVSRPCTRIATTTSSTSWRRLSATFGDFALLISFFPSWSSHLLLRFFIFLKLIYINKISKTTEFRVSERRPNPELHKSSHLVTRQKTLTALKGSIQRVDHNNIIMVLSVMCKFQALHIYPLLVIL